MLAAAGTVATLNVIVDPFWRFDLVNISGFNAQRPQFSAETRLAKLGVACRLQPSQVVLGTSRVEVGIDPQHSGVRSGRPDHRPPRRLCRHWGASTPYCGGRLGIGTVPVIE